MTVSANIHVEEAERTLSGGRNALNLQGEEAAYLADDVSVGMLVRWINREHRNAAKENPPNMDYMRAMQRIGEAVESALKSYRRSLQSAQAASDGKEH